MHKPKCPPWGRGEGRECIFPGTTHFGFTFGKSLRLNVVSISRLYSFVFNKSTHFFIHHVDSQGKYDENYSGHIFLSSLVSTFVC